MKKNKFILFIVFLVFTSSIISCTGGKTTDVATEEEIIPEDIVELRFDQIQLINIELGKVEMLPMSGKLKVNGIITVEPQNYATVCMPLGGFVKSTSIMPGDKVEKGQILARLENQEFVDIQQNYLEAKNKFEYAEAEFKRHTALYQEDVYSKSNLQQVTADYKNLKAQVTSYQQKLALIGIDPKNLNEEDISRSVAVVSPISGYVKKVNINIGKFVSPSDVLFEIVNSDKLFLELSIFEKEVDKVALNQGIEFYINNEDEAHDARIYRTAKSIDNDKSFKVYAVVSSQCKTLLPGMYVNAFIATTPKMVSTLPTETIVSFDDKDYIFVFDKNKEENGQPFTEYRMIEVQKGLVNGKNTEVILPEGFDIQSVQVVIKGAYNLLSAKKNAGEMSC